jgi:tRNA threonylcarbamoyladenosine biosynthesis protein TsaB
MLIMPAVLCIDTSVTNASVALAIDGKLASIKINDNQKEHASFLQPAIELLLKEHALKPKDLAAVTVTNGPGSYTGLRVSLASAKGLCFALQIPLITLSTLEIMTLAAIEYSQLNNRQNDHGFLFCPMIDARRMEVYTALYTSSLEELIPPTAMILNENSLQQQLTSHKIMFFGNGSDKWKAVCTHFNARFETINFTAAHMIQPALEKLNRQDFASLAYTAPLYLKEFHTAAK